MSLTGCIRDAHDTRDLVFGRDAGVNLPLIGSPDEIDFSADFPEVREQIANDCCAHAVSAAAETTAFLDGHIIEEPSVLFLYANARQLAMGRLEDSGSSLRSMFKAMSGQTIRDSRGLTSGLGLVAEKKWPEVAEAVNVLPPDDCYRGGENATIPRYSRIPDGIDSIDGCVSALQRRRFPTICLTVDESFVNVGGTIYMGNDGSPILGNHCVLGVGYSFERRAFLIRNSWGPRFGINGYAWIHQSVVADHSFDKWVLEVAPEKLS